MIFTSRMRARDEFEDIARENKTDKMMLCTLDKIEAWCEEMRQGFSDELELEVESEPVKKPWPNWSDYVY